MTSAGSSGRALSDCKQTKEKKWMCRWMVEWTDCTTTGNCVRHNAHVQASSQVPYVWELIETLKCILFYCNYAASFTHNTQLLEAHVGKQISLVGFFM